MNHTMSFKLAPLALSVAIVGGAMLLPATPASAAPAANIAAIPSQNDMLQQVQWRRHGHYRGYYGRHYRRDHGGAVAAGVIGGLALGAMLGAAASAPPPPPAYYGPAYGDRDWLAYCSSKYRSFDPRSGTYLGYDGLRHPCQ